jgi:hypothetical protein
MSPISPISPDHCESDPTNMGDEQLLRYSRHILLPDIGIEGQTQFLRSHVLIFGRLGFTGSHVPGVFGRRSLDAGG